MSEPPYIRLSDGSIRQGEVLPPELLPPLGLAGAALTFIRVDHQTRLQLGLTEIVIGTPFRLRDAGREHLLDPEDRAGLGPLLAAYPDTLAECTITPHLTLRLAFSSGALLEVPQDPASFGCHGEPQVLVGADVEVTAVRPDARRRRRQGPVR